MMFKHVPLEFPYKDLDVSTGKRGRFYVSPDGKKYPSVTTVLGFKARESIREWRQRVGEEEANRISRIAAERGGKVHDLIEGFLNNEEHDLSSEMPNVTGPFKSLQPILAEHIDEIYALEQPVYSRYLGVAGRLDCLARWDGVPSIVDFKTSNKVKQKWMCEGYFEQCCAYSIAIEELTGNPVPNIVVVMSVDGHDPIIFKEHRDNWDKKLIADIKEYQTKAAFGQTY